MIIITFNLFLHQEKLQQLAKTLNTDDKTAMFNWTVDQKSQIICPSAYFNFDDNEDCEAHQAVLDHVHALGLDNSSFKVRSYYPE